MTPDEKGVVRDVTVRTCPRCLAFLGGTGGSRRLGRKGADRIPTTVLHRDVRRLVVLLPVEEQGDQERATP